MASYRVQAWVGYTWRPRKSSYVIVAVASWGRGRGRGRRDVYRGPVRRLTSARQRRPWALEERRRGGEEIEERENGNFFSVSFMPFKNLSARIIVFFIDIFSGWNGIMGRFSLRSLSDL